MRLAHFSDIHLLSLDGSTRLRDWMNKRWAGGINILLNRGRHYASDVFTALVDDLNALGIEQIVCTGDVSNLSLESEFTFARAQFDRLAAGPRNVTCVPGNHDTYIAEIAGLFERHFAPYQAADDGWGWDDDDRYPLVRVRGHAALVGLTTSQPSGLLMGHGELGDKQRGRLEQVLADPRLADKARVVIMHHPSTGRHARSWRRGLRDHAAFAELLGRTGAELVLHGHEHLDLRGELDGPGGAKIPVHGVQSGTYAIPSAKRGARYRVYTLGHRDGGRPHVLRHELHAWVPAKPGFEVEAVL